MILYFYKMRLGNWNSGTLSATWFEPVAMEVKYLHVGISNYAEMPLVLTNHLLEMS